MANEPDPDLEALLDEYDPAVVGPPPAEGAPSADPELEALLDEYDPAVSGGRAPAAAPAPKDAFDPNGQSQGRSFARGALQGASLGFSEGGAAFFGALMGGDPLLGVNFDGASFGERYAKAHDFYSARNKAASDAFPKSYLGGELAGSVVAPGAGAAAQAAKAPTRLARIASLAKSGAVTGGASALGHAEGSAKDQVGATVAGALVGGAATPALSEGARAAAVPMQRLAKALRRKLGTALARVAGARGVPDARAVGGAARLSEAGLEGEAEGLIRPWDFGPGRLDRQEERVAEYADKAFNDITAAIDDVGARVKVGPLVQALQASAGGLRKFSRTAGGKLTGVSNLVDDLVGAADAAGTVDGRTLQTAKTLIDDMVSTWDPDARSRVAQDLSKALYRAVMEAQEDAVASSAQGAGLGAYQAAKRASALAQRLERFQASARSRESQALHSLGGLHNVLGLLAAGHQGFETGEWDRAAGAYLAARGVMHPNSQALLLKLLAGGAAIPGRIAESGANPLVARALAEMVAADQEGGRLAQELMTPRGQPISEFVEPSREEAQRLGLLLTEQLPEAASEMGLGLARELMTPRGEPGYFGPGTIGEELARLARERAARRREPLPALR